MILYLNNFYYLYIFYLLLKIKNNYKLKFLGEKCSKNLICYKVIILGIYGVGKTSIINKLLYNGVDKDYAPTISVDIKTFQVKVNDKIIQTQIWDCCGNDEFASQTPNLFKNASIAILVYAINDKKKSFNNLKNWYNLVKENSFDNIIFLIGNKIDLEKERQVTIEDVEEFKHNYNNIKIFFETSAISGDNIDKLLENIAISLYEKIIKEENILNEKIKLNKEDFTKAKKKEKKKKFC